jgi:hypothetical protein
MLDRADRSLRSQHPTTRELAQDVDTLAAVLLTTRNQSSSNQPLQRAIGELVSPYGIRALIFEFDRHCMMRLAVSNSRKSIEWTTVHEKLSAAADLLETLKLDT